MLIMACVEFMQVIHIQRTSLCTNCNFWSHTNHVQIIYAGAPNCQWCSFPLPGFLGYLKAEQLRPLYPNFPTQDKQAAANVKTMSTPMHDLNRIALEAVCVDQRLS